jgi:signal transduction histidine kinase
MNFFVLMRMMERSGIVRSAKQFGLGFLGLVLVTVAALRLNLHPGAVSLLYLIAVVCVSLGASFIPSFAVSLVAASLLHYYFVPRFSPPASKNPLVILASAAFLLTSLVITTMVSRVRKMTEAQLALRFDERLAERTRIARELHDTLLQSFQGSLLKLHAVTYLLPDHSEAKEELEIAIEQAQAAIVEGRNAVQGLRSSAIVTNDLARELRSLGEELASNQRGQPCHEFRVQVEGEARDLTPLVRDEVSRIGSEAVRNALRHANAARVEVLIRYDPRLLRLRVRDDGKGIEPRILSGEGRAGHFGLPGMRERAKLAGGRLSIWSEPDSGTEIKLTIPASAAYLKSPSSGRSLSSRAVREAGIT